MAALLLALGALAQELEKKTPVPTRPKDDCEQNTCISKVLYLPNFSKASELQEVVNTFRTVADFTDISPNESDHTVALKGTLDQIAVAEKLLSVLESLRSSGGHDRSSILIYQLKGRLSGTAESERTLAQHPRSASTICELSTCYIKALYLPDFSMPELQNFTNRVRTTADMPRTAIIPSRHVLVIRGTSEQVTLAGTLSMNASPPQ